MVYLGIETRHGLMCDFFSGIQASSARTAPRSSVVPPRPRAPRSPRTKRALDLSNSDGYGSDGKDCWLRPGASAKAIDDNPVVVIERFAFAYAIHHTIPKLCMLCLCKYSYHAMTMTGGNRNNHNQKKQKKYQI